jgi:hypothetical protein
MSMLSAACAGKAHVCPVAKNPGINGRGIDNGAEVAIPKNLFADILRMIAELRPPPVASTA